MRSVNRFLLGILTILLLTGCRAPAPGETPSSYATSTAFLATRRPPVLPSLLPTLTPLPTRAPTATTTPAPTFTASVPYPPLTSSVPTNTAVVTTTLDPISFYQQAIRLCESEFVATTILTATQPGAHLPTFILLNKPYESTYWEPVTGMEWIDAEKTDEAKSVVCLRASRRQDATYSDQTVGYTLHWEARLITWPEGRLIASQSFWGEGPPRQNASGAMVYGKAPSEQLVTWLACELQPQNAHILCQSRGPLAFSPDNQNLVTGQDSWDILQKQKVASYPGHRDDIAAMALSPAGDVVASVEIGARDIHLWQTNTGELRHLLSGHEGEVTALAFAPDGRWLLSASQDGSIRIWDVQNGKLQRILAQDLGWLHAIAISPDGKLVAAGTWAQPGLVYLWDFQAGSQVTAASKPIKVLEASKIYISALAFSPDSLLLATAGLDGSIRLWDTETAHHAEAGMRLVGLLQGHTGGINCLAFSPDGKRLASGGDDRKVIVWQVANGQIWHTLPGALGPVVSVVYSPNSQWLAAGDGNLTKIWPNP